MNNWHSQDGMFSIDKSLLNTPYLCPKCNHKIDLLKPVITHKDSSNEDTYAWAYRHQCGADLLVIND